MAVSDDMTKVIQDYHEDILTGYMYPDHDEETAQWLINAGWAKFDPVDERTWPETPRTPNNDQWLVLCDDGDMAFGSFIAVKTQNFVFWHGVPEGKTVIRYADPEHFRYEGEG